MSILDIKEKIKTGSKNIKTFLSSGLIEHFDVKEDIFIVVVIIFIGLSGFGLGKLSASEKQKEEIQIQSISLNDISPKVEFLEPRIENIKNENQSGSTQGFLVASKKGKKYHFPWCTGATQISSENKIWFNSYKEAQEAGYTAATNCQGLK